MVSRNDTELVEAGLEDEDLLEVGEGDEAEAVELKADADPAQTEEKVKRSFEPLPEGYVTPVGFTKVLENERGVEVRPQTIFSYTKNSAAFKEITERHTDGRYILPVQEALDAWDQKEERKAQREAKAAESAGDEG